MYLLSTLLFSMFYVFIIVACNTVALRNFSTNLRGSEDYTVGIKIDNYKNAIKMDEPFINKDNIGYVPSTATVYDKLPDNFNVNQYLMERNWKNIIGKHLQMAVVIENVAIVE